MLTEICEYLKNWFDRDRPKFNGLFIITGGQITFASGDMGIQDGQYFRVIGSVFNDGVWKYGEDELTDESFDGAVWLMAVPHSLILLAADIATWQDKYGRMDSVNMSPYQSESFGGYSYSKSQGGSADGNDGSVVGWESVFKSKLMRYKKL